MSERGLILAGDVRLGFFNDAGAFLGYQQDPINVSEFTLTPGEGEQRDRVSRMRETFGQALDSVTLPAPWTMTMTTDSIVREVLKGMFLGQDVDIAVSSGSVTEEEVVARTGKWVPLANVNLDEGTPPTVTGPGGSPSHAASTDYVIDYRNGMIRAIEGGAITDGDTIEVGYSYGARDGFRVNGAKSESITTALLMDGKSLRQADSGKVIRLIIEQVALRPAGGTDLKSDEWLAPQLTGTLITPTGKSQPFFYEEYTPGT